METSDSDEEMRDASQTLERLTPPPKSQRTFVSKADLMRGIMYDDIPDYDFDEDSDDSDLEIYGKVKPRPLPAQPGSFADTDKDESIAQDEGAEDHAVEYGLCDEEGRNGMLTPKRGHRGRFLLNSVGGEGSPGKGQDIGPLQNRGKEAMEYGFLSPAMHSPFQLERHHPALRPSLENENEETKEPLDEQMLLEEGGDSNSAVDEDAAGDEDEDEDADVERDIEDEEGGSEAQNEDEEAVKQEDNVNVKSEDDAESIHYGDGDGDEGEGCTIHVDPSTKRLTAVRQAWRSLSNHTKKEEIPFLNEAPTEVQNLLDRWFEVHGRTPPPCTVWSSQKWLSVSQYGKQAYWRHLSGEHLTPSLYQLPDLIEEDAKTPPRRILVVQGPTIGPHIVATFSGPVKTGLPPGCVGGTKYKIWLGIDSPQSDGFDPNSASVWKGFAHNFVAGKPKSKWKGATLKASQKLPPQDKHKVGALSESIPEAIRLQIEAWMSVHGRIAPPCTCHMVEALLRASLSGVRASWWHVSGEKLEPSLHPLEEGRQGPRLIVMHSRTFGPFIVRYLKGVLGEAVAYQAWKGVEGVDARGFEAGCSVYKVQSTVVTTPEKLRKWQAYAQSGAARSNNKNKARSARTTPLSQSSHYAGDLNGNGHITRTETGNEPAKSLRPRDSIVAPSKFLPANLAETRRANYPPSIHRKRKRDEDEDDDGETLLHSFMSPAAEKIPQAPRVSTAELLEHIKNNVVLLFFPKVDGPPRVRLLGSCDSVQKLFAQALAGDVFGNSGGSGTKVLGMTFGGGQNKSRSLVEDDDQDFEDLIAALSRLDCWVVEDGLLQGSITVEIREK
jgi:hypothetical protein